MGTVRVAAVLLVAGALAGCGGTHRAAFCGLVHNDDGFAPVEAVHDVSCTQARAVVTQRNWTCSRAMHAAYELDCRNGAREVQVLETVPVRPTRNGSVVTLADWSFRLHGGVLQARRSAGWIDLTRAPYCVTDAPRSVLVALGLSLRDGCSS